MSEELRQLGINENLLTCREDISFYAHLKRRKQTKPPQLCAHVGFSHTHTHTQEIDLFGVIKTLWLSPNLHIEFDLPLRAALIFPLSHMVQCAASDTQ